MHKDQSRRRHELQLSESSKQFFTLIICISLFIICVAFIKILINGHTEWTCLDANTTNVGKTSNVLINDVNIRPNIIVSCPPASSAARHANDLVNNFENWKSSSKQCTEQCTESQAVAAGGEVCPTCGQQYGKNNALMHQLFQIKGQETKHVWPNFSCRGWHVMHRTHGSTLNEVSDGVSSSNACINSIYTQQVFYNVM